MPVNERDISIIEKIYRYCMEIEEAHESFQRSYEKFLASSLYKNAVCLCLMQIGELSKNLSEQFRQEHKEIPWRQIRGMRNVVAHEYGEIDTEIVWESATEDITELERFCKGIIAASIDD